MMIPNHIFTTIWCCYHTMMIIWSVMALVNWWIGELAMLMMSSSPGPPAAAIPNQKCWCYDDDIVCDATGPANPNQIFATGFKAPNHHSLLSCSSPPSSSSWQWSMVILIALTIDKCIFNGSPQGHFVTWWHHLQILPLEPGNRPFSLINQRPRPKCIPEFCNIVHFSTHDKIVERVKFHKWRVVREESAWLDRGNIQNTQNCLKNCLTKIIDILGMGTWWYFFDTWSFGLQNWRRNKSGYFWWLSNIFFPGGGLSRILVEAYFRFWKMEKRDHRVVLATRTEDGGRLKSPVGDSRVGGW